MHFLAVLYLFLFITRTLTVRFRQDRFALVQKGSSIQLPCEQDDTHEYMYWYRQSAGQGLVLLYLSTYDGMVSDESKDPRFSAVRPNRQNFPLNVTDLQPNDTAVYYCASSSTTVTQSHVIPNQKPVLHFSSSPPEAVSLPRIMTFLLILLLLQWNCVNLLQVLQSPPDLVLHPGSPMKVTCSVYGTSNPFTYWYRRTLREGIRPWFYSLGTGNVDPPRLEGFSASRPNDSHFVLESAGVAEMDSAVWYCAGVPTVMKVKQGAVQ